MTKKTVFFFALILMSTSLNAQSTWTLRMAIDTALQNNLGIRIAKNESIIAHNASTAAAAGMLPRVDVSAATSEARNEIRQEFRTGEVLSRSGVEATNTQVSAELSWTLFDGFRMFATREKLKILEDLGELNVRAQMLDVMAQTAKSYFDLQRQQLLVRFTENGLALYEERVRIAKKKLEIGSAPKTEFLQAAVDYNAQLTILTSRETALSTAQVVLNGLLMRSVIDSIVVEDSLSVKDAPSYEYFLSKIESGNLSMKEQMFMKRIAEKQLDEVRSGYYPLLDLNAGYNYSKSETSQGFFLENRNMGPSAGLRFNWNLFNGNTLRTDVRNAKIITENSRLAADQVKQDVQVALRTSWLNYSAALSVYNREIESNSLAKENLSITGERFRLGESTVLELKEAQRTYEDAQSRLAGAYYEVRIALIQIMQLIGEFY